MFKKFKEKACEKKRGNPLEIEVPSPENCRKLRKENYVVRKLSHEKMLESAPVNSSENLSRKNEEKKIEDLEHKSKNKYEENKKIIEVKSQKIQEEKKKTVHSLKKKFEKGLKSQETKPDVTRKLRPISTHFQVLKGGPDVQNRSVHSKRGVSASDDRFLEIEASINKTSLKTQLARSESGLLQEGTTNGKRKLQNLLDDQNIQEGGQPGKRRQYKPVLLSADCKTGLGNFKSIE